MWANTDKRRGKAGRFAHRDANRQILVSFLLKPTRTQTRSHTSAQKPAKTNTQRDQNTESG